MIGSEVAHNSSHLLGIGETGKSVSRHLRREEGPELADSLRDGK